MKTPCFRSVRAATWLLAIAALLAAADGRAQPLDVTFNPNANREVFALAAQPDGKILLGGNFASIGTTSRGRLARIDARGSVDTGFNPGPSSTVFALRVQPDGKILVGGGFSTIAGAAVSRLARLNADGSLDTSFTAAADDWVQEIVLQPDGKILVGGVFTQINGASRVGLARLNPDGSLDVAFDARIAGSTTSSALRVEAILVQPDGRILIGGNFASVGGQSRTAAARLSADGSLDHSFNPNATNYVLCLGLQSDGKFLLGGTFSPVTARNSIARFNRDGSADTTFAVTTDGSVQQMAVQADGKILVAGTFTTIGGTLRNRLARLERDGRVDPTFDPNVTGVVGNSSSGVYALTVPGSNQILLGGAFDSVSGQPRNGIARLGTPFPVITSEPASVVAAAGANVTFSVAATGDGIRYQWRRNGAEIGGATGAALALADVQSASAGVYTATLTNAFGSTATSGAVLTIGPAPEPAYAFATLAGAAGQAGRADGTGAEARFAQPTGIAVDGSGNVFVMDGGNGAVRKITPAGVVSTVASQPGWGLALDSAGNIYVADAAARVAKITPAGGVSTFAGTGVPGFADGTAERAQFRGPRGIAVDRAGNVFVADTDNFVIRKIAPAGNVTTLAGAPGRQGDTDGAGAAARFGNPWALAIDPSGNLYVADAQAVRKVTPDGIVTTLAGNPVSGSADGTGRAAQFNVAIGLAVDAGGNVYAADVFNHTIRKISAAGEVTTVAGSAGASGSTDGTGPSARFNGPWSVAVDPNGTLYVVDNGNATIRKGTPAALPLAISAQPAAVHAIAGSRTALSVGATGRELGFQWKKDGAAIAGATTGTFAASASAADMGFYTVEVGSRGTTVESTIGVLTVAAPGATSRIVNVSTRGYVPAGDALTPGFVLGGSGIKRLVVRAVGPSLIRFGVGGVLVDPQLELVSTGGSGAPVLVNNDWGTAADLPALLEATAATGAFPLDHNSRDAAALAAASVANGGYTVRASGDAANASGIALVEVYDADPAGSSSQLINVSTRGFVGTGSNALVPGFVIRGDAPRQLLIRVVGPGLATFGVTGVLADPQLALIPAGRSAALAGNDNWGGDEALADAFRRVGAFALAPDSKDAVVLVRLPPGGYTVLVSGAGDTTGNALVEIYDVPGP